LSHLHAKPLGKRFIPRRLTTARHNHQIQLLLTIGIIAGTVGIIAIIIQVRSSSNSSTPAEF
jgi:hypothetical protein